MYMKLYCTLKLGTGKSEMRGEIPRFFPEFDFIYIALYCGINAAAQPHYLRLRHSPSVTAN